MSSFRGSQQGEYVDRRAGASPTTPSIETVSDSHEPSIRPMRLKVLYTFDDQNKTNCLARWPEILNIRTAHLDETTQIGVIELKTCIQTVLAASPELLPKFGQDYTVYAYDYSEYETPLVGQGMLSRMLAATSSTPYAPAQQSETKVTGRVCKNILGLFGGNIQETLEVKLRLVPVPTCLQNEYVANVKQRREVPEEFDAQSWMDLQRTNVDTHPGSDRMSISLAGSFGQPQVGMEYVQQLMSDDFDSQHVVSQPSLQRSHSYSTSVISGLETVRNGSPTPSMQSAFTQDPAFQARPFSRASSNVSARAILPQGRAPTEMEYMSNDEMVDEGPVKKRAKIMKADHPGKAALGKKKDPLRVTASTAASVRVFQPIAVRPTDNPSQSLEAPPRVPTPVPQGPIPRRRPGLNKARSSLGQETVLTSDSGYVSPYGGADSVIERPTSAATSPEFFRAPSMSKSPGDPGSSPPIIRPTSPGTPAAPSSPVLPSLAHHQDSGFMSANLDELFGEDREDVEVEPNAEDAEMAGQYLIGSEILSTSKQPEPELPTQPAQKKDDQSKAAEEAKRRYRSHQNACKAAGVKQSQTWAAEEASSDAPRPKRTSKPKLQSQPRKTSSAWNKEKRKAAIEGKAKSSIEAGQLPPFCENCGAIETPTWRKAYSKIYAGDHSQVDLNKNKDGIVAVQIVDKHEDGSTKTFKIFKKSKNETDESFVPLLLCNPCGIWLSTRKIMRPESVWNAKPKAADRPRKRTKSDSQALTSDAVVPPSEAMSDAPTIPFNANDAAEQTHGTDGACEPDLPRLPAVKGGRSASSSQASKLGQSKSEADISPEALAALQRAIQSSPGNNRFLGSQQSPIEVDGTPDPARRKLFSSPKTPGPLGIGVSERNSCGKSKQPTTFNEKLCKFTSSTEDDVDKENVPPRPTTPNSIDDLFSDYPTLTPLRNGDDNAKLLLSSPSVLFKTPLPPRGSPSKASLTTGDFFSSAAKAFLHGPPRTPHRTPSKQKDSPAGSAFSRHLDLLVSDAAGDATSLSPSNQHILADLGLNLPGSMPGARASHTSVPHMNDGGTPSRMFRTADFDFGDFPSSDVTGMPSSPPGWFDVYEDPTEGDEKWDWGFGSSPVKGVESSPTVTKGGDKRRGKGISEEREEETTAK